MKQVQHCMIGRCCRPAAVLHKPTGVWRCREHQKELDAFMEVYIDQLAHELAAMNDEQLAAWMKS